MLAFKVDHPLWSRTMETIVQWSLILIESICFAGISLSPVFSTRSGRTKQSEADLINFSQGYWLSAKEEESNEEYIMRADSLPTHTQ